MRLDEEKLIDEAGFGKIRDAVFSGAEVTVQTSGGVFDRKSTGDALVEYLSRVHKANEASRAVGRDRIEGVNYKYKIRVVIEAVETL